MKALRIIRAWMAVLGWVFGLFYGIGWITTHPETPFWIATAATTFVAGVIGLIGLLICALNTMAE